MKMNIVLIGYRCSGKSLLGRMLADDMGMRHVDTDRLLEKQVGTTIADYVAQKGWDAFRMLEKLIVRSISNHDQQVISTGGGVILDWENVRHLRQSGWVVWLRTSPSVIRSRMTKDPATAVSRPGLTQAEPVLEIENVLNERSPLYERACHWAVNTDRLTPEQLIREIVQSCPDPWMGFCTTPGIEAGHGR